MKEPLVSILIPAFNSEKYIKEAVDSALTQTYTNIEVIVHDDASTDRTGEILKSIKDKRLKVITTKNNHGMVPGWNYIMKKANGEFIKFLASDDLLHENCVSEMVKGFKKGVSLVTCRRNFINDKGEEIKSLGFSNKTEVVNGVKHVKWILNDLSENKIGEPTSVMFRVSDIKKVGYFDPQFHNFVDFEYWMRFLLIGDLYYINKSLCSFRVHDLSSTSRAIRDGLFIHDIFNLIEKYYGSNDYSKKLKLTESMKDKVIKKKTLDVTKNIKDLFAEGNISKASKYFRVLSSHVNLNYMTRETLRFLLK